MFENLAYGSGADDHRDDATRAAARAPMWIHLVHRGDHARPIGFLFPHSGGGGIGADGAVYRESRVSPGEHSLDLFWRESLSSFQEAEDPGLEIRLGCGGPGQVERSDLSMPIGTGCR